MDLDAQSQTLLPVLSLIVALLAVFLGPLLSWVTSKRQVESSLKIANKQIVAPMRQVWINNLRDLISEVCSSCLHYWQCGFEERKEEEHRRINDLEHKIQLMINPNELDHQELADHIQRMVHALGERKDGDGGFFESYNTVMDLSQKVLKEEWNRVKAEI